MTETTAPRPGPELFPPSEPHPQSPFANRRLEQMHANVGLSHTTQQIALILLGLPSTRREAAYQDARRSATSGSEGVLVLLEQAARMHELDQMFPPAGTGQQPDAPASDQAVTVSADHFDYLMALARAAANSSGGAVLRNKHLDTIDGAAVRGAAAEQPSTWWKGQPVEVDLYPGGEDRWSAARLVSIDSEGRALVVHLDDGARQLVELAKLRLAPLPYLQVPDAEAQS